MTANKDLKRVIRQHARSSGMSYTAARRHLLGQTRPDRDGEATMKGWRITGSHAHEYELGVTNTRVDGHRVAFLRCKAEELERGAFGAQVQAFAPDEYLGKRVRFSGLLKAESVTKWAGLWMRVDGRDTPRSGVHLAFDNMFDRSLTGTTDWTPCEIVLDVPTESAQVLVGTLLSGLGTVYMAAFALDVVPETVPTTGEPIAKQPVNLSFDEE